MKHGAFLPLPRISDIEDSLGGRYARDDAGVLVMEIPDADLLTVGKSHDVPGLAVCVVEIHEQPRLVLAKRPLRLEGVDEDDAHGAAALAAGLVSHQSAQPFEIDRQLHDSTLLSSKARIP